MKKICFPSISCSSLLDSIKRTIRRTKKTKPIQGFTLIELLVVIAIIAILAALTLNTAGFIQKKSARARADAEINALSTALESYKADNGDYPVGNNGDPSSTGAPGTNNAFLRTNLVGGTNVYFEFSKGMGTNLTTGPIYDPFGEPYGYYYVASGSVRTGLKNGVGFYDLWSRSFSTNTNIWNHNW